MSTLGPKPRMPPPPAGGEQGQGLEFYNSGGMQAGSFPTGPASAPAPSPQGLGVQPPGGFGGSMQPTVFTPTQQTQQSPPCYNDDIENEPPLLEELGIDVGNIWLRMKGIALFKRLDEEVLRDADLGGPIVIILGLGLCLLLRGKLVLGLLYGWGLTSCIFICLLINVMSQKGGIDLYCTTSILGYGLIPIVLLAFIGVFISLKSTFGTVVSMVCIFWATATSSRFFATAIAMHQQRWLVAYPVGLVYTLVSLITVF